MYFSSQSSGCYHSTPSKPQKPRISKSMSADGANPQYFMRLNSLEDDPTKSPEPKGPKVRPRTFFKDRPYIEYYASQSRVQPLRNSSNQMFQAFHSPYGGFGGIAHMPFNLTKGHYEYWMSVPHSPTEEMDQGFASVSIPQTLSAQLTKTFTSLVGGVCDLVTGTLDPSSMWNSKNAGLDCNQRLNDPHLSSSSVTSKLNPHAKCFTPLNPLAQEFHPSSQPPSIILPDNLCEAVSESLSMPCSGQKKPQSPSKVEGSCSEDGSPIKTDMNQEKLNESGGADLEASQVGESEIDTTLDTVNGLEVEEESEEEDEDTDEEEDEDVTSIDGARFRTLSGSSDDGFITFGSPQSGASSQTCCDITTFVRNSEKDSKSNGHIPNSSKFQSKRNVLEESSDDEDDDSESDWDEIDHPNDKFDEETLAMFADPIMSIGCCKPESSISTPKFSFNSPEKPYPTPSKKEISQKLVVANDTWNTNYHGVDEVDGRKKTSVSIAPSESYVFIYEDPELSEALVEARKSDFQRRQADKERMEILMAPIFKPDHRQRVWERIHGDDQAA